ncbi:FAD-dependent oxidoreductase [Stigmatella erecta]|uniref:FAD binding domain-containing protein n=1 Tax=Stigmatella erecta TaxID=83460 RepID=A0A1I0LEQ1_9BACT|nr:FAD-dependent oxidoreductase [Stigmatella erecta]SEU37828.1 FAD binding domain-containing protein [Stigmatella erecta]
MPTWDLQADVVIVGSGGAALSAAAAVVDQGASALLLEAAETPGGTTRRSGGAFWIPNNSLMRAQGLADPRDGALQLMARTAYPALYTPEAPFLGLPPLQYGLLAAFYDNAAPAIDRLTQLGALQPVILGSYGFSPQPLSDPDYHAELPENLAPYGRVLTARAPPGSMQWPGVFLADGMLAHLRGKDVPVLTQHRVTGVLTNARGEVVGVEAEHEGTSRAVRARKAVVFASGGFAHDSQKARAFLRGPLFGSGSVPTSRGAFIDIASRLGARLDNLANGFFYQVALEDAAARGGEVARNDAHVFFPYGDSTVVVNKQGVRVANEKAPYHERAQTHFHWSGKDYPHLVQFMIWDEGVAQEPTFWPWRGVVPLPGQESPLVVQAQTLAQLAQRLEERLERLRGRPFLSATVPPSLKLAPDFVSRLEETLQRFNTFAATGVDLDFHRGATALEQAWQGPSRSTTGNRTLYPMSRTGPYYAALLGAATLDTCGGPAIGPDAQVLRTDGSAIPGLYGAGNCIASPSGQAYWGAGGTLGPAMTFGFIAGRNAARESLKEE